MRPYFAMLVFVIVIFHDGFAPTIVSGQENVGTNQKGRNWATFLGPTADGKSTETGIITDWSQGKLKLIWSCKTGEGYGIGAVAEGKFFHFGKTDGKATLRCMDAKSGKPIWEYAYPTNYRDLYGYDGGPRASPIVDGERIYIYGAEGMLHCLDVNSGKVTWKLDVNSKYGVVQNFFGVASTPVVYEDKLILMVGGSPEDSQKVAPGRLDLIRPNGTGVVALDKLTGEEIYVTVNDLASYCSLRIAQLNGKDVLLAWMRGSLFGLNPNSGTIAFEFPWRAKKLESVNASTPVVVEDHVFISECYQLGSALLKVDEDGAKQVWTDKSKREKSLEAHWNTPVIVGDFLYGCSGRHSSPAQLRCINWKTGELMWKQKGLARSSVTYVDGHLVVLGERGDLLLIRANPNKFDLVTTYEPGDGENAIRFRDPCWAAPIISHGLMYVRGRNQMACFELIPNREWSTKE